MTPPEAALLKHPDTDPDIGKGGSEDHGSNAAKLNGGSLDLPKLLDALQAMRVGDFSVRLPTHDGGLFGRVAEAFNDIVAANERIAQQLEHVGEVVGHEGKTKTRVRFGRSCGAWGEMEESVNTLIDDRVWCTTQVTRAI